MRIAVYGTLKKGFHANNLLTNSKYLGTFTQELPYAMYDLGAFPALTPSEKKYEITFEIYEIDNKTLEELDRYEGYPSLYTRDVIQVNGMEVSIYVMKENVFTSRVPMEKGFWNYK